MFSPSWANSNISALFLLFFSVRFFSNSLDSADCISKKASSQPLAETAVTDKETDAGEPDCLEDKKLVDTSVSHNSSEQIPDDVTVMAEESQSFKTSTFTRTISPPTLGTLRSCFSWSGSLGDISRTPSPSPSTALQQFRRKSDSSTSLPENTEKSDIAPLKRWVKWWITSLTWRGLLFTVSGKHGLVTTQFKRIKTFSAF